MSYPILSSDFFQSHTPSKEFFSQWQKLFQWSPYCLPVYLWNEILYVAFSTDEPPTINNNQNRVVFIKADAQELINLWNYWNDQQEAYEPSRPTAESSHEGSLSLLSEDEQRSQSVRIPSQKQTDHSWSDRIFEQMKYHYTKSMILLRSGNAMVPWKWSNDFGPETKEASHITLNQPSAFRVVARTLKSYHGYTVPTTVNDQFAEEWNQGTPPDTLTIAPIVASDKLVGFLLGIGPTTANTKGSLSAAEKLATETGQFIQQQAFQNAA